MTDGFYKLLFLLAKESRAPVRRLTGFFSHNKGLVSHPSRRTIVEQIAVGN